MAFLQLELRGVHTLPGVILPALSAPSIMLRPILLCQTESELR